MQTIPMTMQGIIQAAKAGIHPGDSGPLAWPEWTNEAPAFNRLAYTDFAILSEADERLEWQDYCPAYALGLLSYEAYCRGASPKSEAALQSQWNQLRGDSRLEWEQARTIIARSWNALTRLQHEHAARLPA